MAIALPIWRDVYQLGPWQVGMLTDGLVGLAAGADVPTALAVISDAAPAAVRGRLTAVTQVMWIGAVLATFALGFAVSTLGFAGTRILVGHLVGLAVLTLGVRLLLTGVFYLAWNIASSTLGIYGTYFTVTVTGLSQSEATGLVLITFPPALLMSLIFVRLADSVWRDRLFVVAMILQICAFGVGAVTGGTVVAGMIILIVLYSLSNVFGGEAIYKVWSQLLLPADLRATSIGLTYAAARAVAATFMLIVPTLIDHDPALLLWSLTGCVAVSGAIGLVITRHPSLTGELHPARPSSATGADLRPAD